VAAPIAGSVKGALALAILLTAVDLLVDDSTLSLIIWPIIILLVVYMIFSVPMRMTLMALMCSALAFENPSELPAYGAWRSPIYKIGAIMLTHLNGVTGVSGLFFSGTDIVIVLLFLVALYRKTTGDRIDRIGQAPTPKPLIQLALLSLAGTAYVWIVGLLRGGSNAYAIWQVDKVVYLPLLVLLFQMGLRGPADYKALGTIVVAAATYKAIIATYVMNTVSIPPDWDGNTSLPYATSHHDSILFATAAVLLLSLLIHKGAHRHAKGLALLLLPIIASGMIYNNRRMVWVQIAMVFLTLYLVTPMNPTKRKMQKVLTYAAPFLIVYVAVGWGSSSGIFKPVGTIRSVVDPGTDASAMTREFENNNLIYTIKGYPIFGSGYGVPYWEIIPMPYMGYDLERFCPHNSILGLWAYCGIIGYSAMTLLWAAGVYFGMRSYHNSKKPEDRAAALMTFGSVLIYMIQCWGDMGLGSWVGVFTVAPGIAMAGKLAVSLGAWPAKQTSKAGAETVPAPSPAPAAPAGFRHGGF
jgi:hypothetical protein